MPMTITGAAIFDTQHSSRLQAGGEGVRLNGQLYKVYFEDELPRNQRYEYHLILRRSWKRMFDSRAGQPVKEMIG